MSDAFTAVTVYDNFKQFFEQNPGRIYRYWVYRRMFTPYEQKQAYMDESFFEQSQALFGVVREVVPLPNGDLLLGIADIAEDAWYLSSGHRFCVPDGNISGRVHSADQHRSVPDRLAVPPNWPCLS